MRRSREFAVVAGVGASLPSRLVTNEELASRMDTSDEWITTRTGIRQRFVVEPGAATSDLAVEAGARALKSAGMAAVDAVLLATTTPDHPCPATAPSVASRLGLTGVPAFDVNAVCSGFVYGLAVADGLIASGAFASVLLIGADTFSTIVDGDDRATVSVFGDGAGACVLRAGRSDEPGAVLGVELGSDGGLRELIIVPDGGSRQRSAGDSAATVSGKYFSMQGKAVYKHAVRRMTQATLDVLDRVGWSVQDVDLLVGHQANKRILDTVVAGLGMPADRALVNVDRVGNTAAASIPIALTDGVASGALREGRRVVLTAFGGGASWGAAALVWPDIAAT
ncbi:3-oxoacyl-[acyl-carrier-protein] synthase III [Lentzea xinjiangensis]|uniref:Beta-ketoacyl-[acyl-carrier-protein] synthase III n=1 Tax=Lentzea xinjiangensis TaxID=402600 RepID=A0A1H9SZC9_9PSEU|nr:beta-ketoacyl-ACP synthase III [Lentzea xinjiangensis]SER89799.1 3-oxoacyl-[acyl-carrier-protein] synthase III [Lentzea xinjiangensis]